jgi:hypothetical protein
VRAFLELQGIQILCTSITRRLKNFFKKISAWCWIISLRGDSIILKFNGSLLHDLKNMCSILHLCKLFLDAKTYAGREE